MYSANKTKWLAECLQNRQLQLLKPLPPSHFMVNQPENYMGLHVLLYGVT